AASVPGLPSRSIASSTLRAPSCLSTGTASGQLVTPGAETVGTLLNSVATSAFSSPSVSRTVGHGPATPRGTCAGLPHVAPGLLAHVYFGRPGPGSSCRTLIATMLPPTPRTGISRPSD